MRQSPLEFAWHPPGSSYTTEKFAAVSVSVSRYEQPSTGTRSPHESGGGGAVGSGGGSAGGDGVDGGDGGRFVQTFTAFAAPSWQVPRKPAGLAQGRSVARS